MADSLSGTETSEFPQQNGKESADDLTPSTGSQDNTESMNSGGKVKSGDKIHASKGDFDDKKIFVGGLSYETNEEKLKTYFGKFGTVIDAEVKRDYEKNSRGFGFVLFENAVDCSKALAENKHELDRKFIDPKMAVAVTRPKKLFVGGISQEVDVDDITEYFSKFGTVVDSEIPMSKETSKHKGFAFLVFEKYDAVTNIVKDTHHYIKGKYRCEVKRAVPRDEHNQKVLFSAPGYQNQYQQYHYQQFGGNGNSIRGGSRYRGRGSGGYPPSYQQSYLTQYPGYSYGGYTPGSYDYSTNSYGSGSNYYSQAYDFYGSQTYGGTGYGNNYNGYTGGTGSGYNNYSGQSYVKNSY